VAEEADAPSPFQVLRWNKLALSWLREEVCQEVKLSKEIILEIESRGLTQREAAEIFQTTEATIRTWRKKLGLPLKNLTYHSVLEPTGNRRPKK
jgi:hypothetical protein